MTPAVDAARSAKVARRVVEYSSDVERGYGVEARYRRSSTLASPGTRRYTSAPVGAGSNSNCRRPA